MERIDMSPDGWDSDELDLEAVCFTNLAGRSA